MKTAQRLAAITGLFAAATLSAGSAFAADDVYSPMTYTDGLPYYVEVRLGGPLPHDYDFDFGGPSWTYDPDAGFFFAGGVGKYFTPNVRADIMVSYSWGHDGTAYDPGGGPFPHTGKVSATSILANGYYEFAPMGPGITPFVGAGAGVTIFNYDNLGAAFFYNDTAAAPTVAAHAGFDYPLTDMIDLTGRYTLSWTGSHSISNTTAGPRPTNMHSHVNNIFTVGLRVKFNK